MSRTRSSGDSSSPLAWLIRYSEFMERICTQCHAVLAETTEADWCPACGGALIERNVSPVLSQPGTPAPEVDHRGIVLPRRHALGGIITPQ